MHDFYYTYDDCMANLMKFLNNGVSLENFGKFSDDIHEFLCTMYKCTTEELLEYIDMSNEDNNLAGMHVLYLLDRFCEKTFKNPTDNLIEAYKKRNKYRISKDLEKILNSIQSRTYSVYEVLEVNNEESFLILRDTFLRTKPIRVEFDKDYPPLAMYNEFTYAKIISVDGKNYICQTNFAYTFGEAEKIIRTAIRGTLTSAGIKLKDYELPPDDMAENIKKVMNQYQNVLYMHALSDFMDSCAIGNEMNQVAYKINKEKEVCNILNSMCGKNMYKSLDDKLWIWSKNPDEENMDEAVGIFIKENMLVLSSLDLKLLKTVSSKVKKKLGNLLKLGIVLK